MKTWLPWLSGLKQHINILWSRLNECHFADNIFKLISWDEYCCIWFKFHWHMFHMIQLTIRQNWLRQWVVNAQATNHYLNQWWPSLLTHICVPGLDESNTKRSSEKLIAQSLIFLLPQKGNLNLSDKDIVQNECWKTIFQQLLPLYIRTYLLTTYYGFGQLSK